MKDVKFVCSKCKNLEEVAKNGNRYKCGVDGDYRWAWCIGPMEFTCPHTKEDKEFYFHQHQDAKDLY